MSGAMPLIMGAQLGFGKSAQQSGSQLQQQGFQVQQQNEIAAANYNKSLARVQANRESSRLGRDIKRALSTQRADAARTGLDVTSKSFLSLMNDTMAQGEREAIQIANNARFGETKISIETSQRLQELQIQADTARFRSDVSRGQSTMDTLGLIGTMVGTMGGVAGA